MRISKFAIPEIIFGRGSIVHLASCAKRVGARRVLFVSDSGLAKAGWVDRIQEILHEDAPYVFLYVPDALPAYSSRFVGVELGPGGIGQNFKDWYVPLDKRRHK